MVDCACWEVGARPEELEGLLEKARARNPRGLVQVFGAASAPNPRALAMVAAQTLAAVESGTTLAEKPDLDLLLRLAGTRQIGEALRRIGYKSSEAKLFLVAAAPRHRGGLGRLKSELADDKRFSELEPRELTDGDLDRVERAALLAAGL